MQPHLSHSHALSQNSGAHRQCGHCCAVADEGAGAWLWDGKFYCRRCLDDAHPGLAEYARTHSTLAETMPYSARDIGKAHAKSYRIATAVFFAVIATIWLMEGPPALAIGLAVSFYVAMGLPLVAVFAWGARYSFERCRPTVCAQGGRVRVRAGEYVVDAPLAQCAWFTGRPSNANLFGIRIGCPYLLPKDTVLILALPPKETFLSRLWKPHWATPRFAAVGFTEQTRRGWEAFLTLTGVPRSTEKEYCSRPVKSKQ